MMHQQLVPYFYPVLAILALERVLRDDGATGARAAAWLVVFAAALVAQFYTAFYTLYFCILGLAAGLLWTLLLPSLRRPFLAALGRNAFAVVACGLGAALLAAPLAWRCLGAAGDVGFRAYDVEAPAAAVELAADGSGQPALRLGRPPEGLRVVVASDATTTASAC